MFVFAGPFPSALAGGRGLEIGGAFGWRAGGTGRLARNCHVGNIEGLTTPGRKPPRNPPYLHLAGAFPVSLAVPLPVALELAFLVALLVGEDGRDTAEAHGRDLFERLDRAVEGAFLGERVREVAPDDSGADHREGRPDDDREVDAVDERVLRGEDELVAAPAGSDDATCSAPAIDVRALAWSARLRPRSAGAIEPA